MGQVTVRLLPPLAEMAGLGAEPSGAVLTVDAKNDATVSEVLDALANKFGNKVRDAVIDSKTGSFHGYILTLVNGCVSGLNAKLKNRDDVAFAVTMGGG
ncbi:MAG: MoaD/ThiS family protein [Candidatus Bathyarchaeia archaeon]